MRTSRPFWSAGAPTRAAVVAVAVGLTLGVRPGRGAAQVVYGFVVDSTTAERLTGTALILLDSAGNPVGLGFADSSGAFAVRAPHAGLYRVRASRLGYQARVTDAIDLRTEPSFSLLLRLYAAPIPLPAVTVEAVELNARLQQEGFYLRKRIGIGRFLTPEMIAQRHPVWVAELFNGMPGVRQIYQDGHPQSVVLRAGDKLFPGRNGDSSCGPTIMVDGMVRRGVALDGAVNVDDIAAVEVYPGAVGMPVQVGGIVGSCGAIVFWTKQGLAATPPLRPLFGRHSAH